MLIDLKKRINLFKFEDDSSASQPEKEGSLVSSWSFLSNSNSSGSKDRSLYLSELKMKVKNYKFIIKVLIHDHAESTRSLNSQVQCLTSQLTDLKGNQVSTDNLIAKLETLVDSKSSHNQSKSSGSWMEKCNDFLLKEEDPQNGSRGSRE